MLKWETVERARMADGSEFVLASHDGDWVVRVDDRILMTNRVHDSEISLAEEALDRVDEPSHVLVGGLGLGYTLRAVLDLIGEDAAVTVAELVPELVEWNRKYVGGLNEHPLEDRRCRVAVGDVFDLIKRSPSRRGPRSRSRLPRPFGASVWVTSGSSLRVPTTSSDSKRSLRASFGGRTERMSTPSISTSTSARSTSPTLTPPGSLEPSTSPLGSLAPALRQVHTPSGRALVSSISSLEDIGAPI